jgi:hypothetical protein
LVGYENSSGVKYVDADGLEQISDELFIVYNEEGIGFGNKDWKSECLSITITFS